jgi:large subunit ribosomal protein L21
VTEGQIFSVQSKDLAEGTTTVEFDRVLMVGDCEGGPKIGTPALAGAKVTATIVDEFKGPKLQIRKHRRRKGYDLRKGHRQQYLRVKVDKILV